MLDIKPILKIINSDLERGHGCDFTDDIFCNFCGESKCDHDCFIIKLKAFFDKQSTDVKEFSDLVYYVAYGDCFCTKYNDIFVDGCSFCDSNDGHRKFCPTRLMRDLLDYQQHSKDEVFEKIKKFTNVEKELGLMHKANLDRANKRKQAEIKKVNSVTCRYCQREFSNTSGKRQHERTNKICSAKFYTDHPEARK